MLIPTVNLLVPVVAGIAGFAFGGFYWGALFGNTWRRLEGKTREELAFTRQALAAGLITRIVGAYILTLFISYAGGKSVIDGAEIGFLAWLGFVITISIGSAMFERESWKLFALRVPATLIEFTMTGAIIGALL